MSVFIPENYESTEQKRLRRLANLGFTDSSVPVPSDCLVGVKELSELLGVTTRTVGNWTSREGSPSPVADLSMGRVYDVREWLRWRRGRGARAETAHDADVTGLVDEDGN